MGNNGQGKQTPVLIYLKDKGAWGVGRAIPTDTLLNAFRMENTKAEIRRLRGEIQRERDYFPICSDRTHGGYYLPATLEECEQYIAWCNGRGRIIDTNRDAARKWKEHLLHREEPSLFHDQEEAQATPATVPAEPDFLVTGGSLTPEQARKAGLIK